MTHSENCTNMVASFEGLRLGSYQDSGGIWSIGYGHTGLDVVEGLTCTQEQALEWLSEDLGTADAAVNEMVTVPLTQNQFDALASFVYNVGAGNFQKSTLLSLLNQGAYAGTAQQFPRWDMVAGVPSAGLLRRREAEQALFLKPEAA